MLRNSTTGATTNEPKSSTDDKATPKRKNNKVQGTINWTSKSMKSRGKKNSDRQSLKEAEKPPEHRSHIERRDDNGVKESTTLESKNEDSNREENGSVSSNLTQPRTVDSIDEKTLAATVENKANKKSTENDSNSEDEIPPQAFPTKKSENNSSAFVKANSDKVNDLDKKDEKKKRKEELQRKKKEAEKKKKMELKRLQDEKKKKAKEAAMQKEKRASTKDKEMELVSNNATLDNTTKSPNTTSSYADATKQKSLVSPNASNQQNTSDSQSKDNNTEGSDSDINTVVSGETINDAKENDEEKLTRFRLSINIMPSDPKTYMAKHNTSTVPDWVTDTGKKLQMYLKKWFEKVIQLDKTAKIVTWTKEGEQSVITKPDGISHKASSRDKYFHGVKAREEGMTFAQVRLYLSIPAEELVTDMQDFLKEYKMSFKKSLIQSQFSMPIGWLAYSNQYTDMACLKTYMEEVTDYEWGFRLNAITESDRFNEKTGEPNKFHKRKQAVFAVVSNKNANHAKRIMENIFGHNKSQSKMSQSCPFSDRYIFQIPENKLAEHPDVVDNWRIIFNRHCTHLNSIDGVIVDYIMTNIDRKIHTPNHGTLSLRQMIYNIKVKDDSGNEFPLFCNIDQTLDGSRLWFRHNRRGHGGLGFVITYLDGVAKYATEMVQGLPAYLKEVYGVKSVITKFTHDKWQEVTGWKWNPKLGKFNTPKEKQMTQMVKDDPMAAALALSSKSKPKEDEKNTESNNVSELAEQALLMKLGTKEAKDDDSLQQDTSRPLTFVPVSKDDAASTTSTITFDSATNKNNMPTDTIHHNGSSDSVQTDATPQTSGASIKSCISQAEESINTFLTNNSAFTFLNPKRLEKNWDFNLTAEENINNMKKFAAFKLAQYTAKAQQQISQMKMPTTVPTATTEEAVNGQVDGNVKNMQTPLKKLKSTSNNHDSLANSNSAALTEPLPESPTHQDDHQTDQYMTDVSSLTGEKRKHIEVSKTIDEEIVVSDSSDDQMEVSSDNQDEKEEAMPHDHETTFEPEENNNTSTFESDLQRRREEIMNGSDSEDECTSLPDFSFLDQCSPKWSTIEKFLFQVRATRCTTARKLLKMYHINNGNDGSFTFEFIKVAERYLDQNEKFLKTEGIDPTYPPKEYLLSMTEDDFEALKNEANAESDRIKETYSVENNTDTHKEASSADGAGPPK